MEIFKGQLPHRPEGSRPQRWLSDELWMLMVACWTKEADGRPSMAEVGQRMEELGGAIDQSDESQMRPNVLV